jgi:hypothetical protein
MGRQKVKDRMVARITWIQHLLISSWIKFWFVTVIPKYLNCALYCLTQFYVFFRCITLQNHYKSVGFEVFTAVVNIVLSSGLRLCVVWQKFINFGRNIPSSGWRSKAARSRQQTALLAGLLLGLTLKMELVDFFETLVDLYWTICHNIPGDSSLHVLELSY